MLFPPFLSMEIQSTQVCISLKSLFSRHKGIGVQFTDEPTGALDSSSATELLSALSEVNQAFGTTILMVTHDPYAASYTDRILYFKDGHIISELKRCNRERREFYEEIMREASRQDEKR